MRLTEEQEQAVALALDTARGKGKHLLTIGGYAGTGKSTILSKILEEEPHAIACAFTGKAASVMQSKGVESAGTIHSKIYRYDEQWDRFVLRSPYEVVDTGGYFLIDEASMVGTKIFEDLQHFDLPVIAVGDHGQLPPVGKDTVNLMQRPDATLEKIHRQAEGNPIIELAQWIRNASEEDLNGTWPDFDPSRENVEILEPCEQSGSHAEVQIVATNALRHSLNRMARYFHFGDESESNPFLAGERIVCLRNDVGLGLFNGLMGTVTADAEETNPLNEDGVKWRVWNANVLWDGDSAPRETRLSSIALGQATPTYKNSRKHTHRTAIVDWGYALTCHKAQGSQWGRVCVYDHRPNDLWSRQRWLYTAVTRASDYVCVKRA